MSTLDVCPETSLQDIQSSLNSLSTQTSGISSNRVAFTFTSNSDTYTISNTSKTCTSSSKTYLGTFIPQYPGTYTISATLKSSSSSYTTSVVSNSMVLQIGSVISGRGYVPTPDSTPGYNPPTHVANTLVVSRKATSASAVTATVLLKAYIPYVFYLTTTGGTGTCTNLKFTTTLSNSPKGELFADIGYSHGILLPVGASNTISATSSKDIYSFTAQNNGIIVFDLGIRGDTWSNGYGLISVSGIVRSRITQYSSGSGSSMYRYIAIVPTVRGATVKVTWYNTSSSSYTINLSNTNPTVYYDLTTLDQNSYLSNSYIYYTSDSYT